jgi:hypothetical protein
VSMSISMARFALANTNDPMTACEAAERLGDGVVTTVPRVAYPGAWVTKQRRNAKVTAYFVTHCTDPEALNSIAARDSRAAVQEALQRNQFLVRSTPRATPEKELEDLLGVLRDPKKARTVSYRALTDVLSRVKNKKESINLTVLTLAASGTTEGVSAYLACCYGMGGKEEMALWSKGTLTPMEVYGRVAYHAKFKVLADLYEAGRGLYVVPKFDPAMTDLFLTHIRPRKKPVSWVPKEFFSPASVDLVVEHPEWWTILAGQTIRDEQFDRLLEVTSKAKKLQTAWVLHGRRLRLVNLIETVRRTKRLLDSEQTAKMVECLNGPEDRLLEWVVRHAPSTELLSYLLGGWKTGTGEVLWPSKAQVGLVLELLSGEPNLSATLAQRMTSRGNKLNDLRAYWSLDLVPGLAWMTRDSRGGEYTFSRLEECGVSLEQMLEQFELAGPTVTLDQLCTTLSSLSRGERQDDAVPARS